MSDERFDIDVGYMDPDDYYDYQDEKMDHLQALAEEAAAEGYRVRVIPKHVSTQPEMRHG